MSDCGCNDGTITVNTNPITPYYNPCCNDNNTNNGSGTDTFLTGLVTMSSACKSMYGFAPSQSVTYKQLFDVWVQRILCQCGCSDILQVSYGMTEANAIAVDPASVQVYLNGAVVACYDLKGEAPYQAAVSGLAQYGVSLTREESEATAGEYYYRWEQTQNCTCPAYTFIFIEGEAVC